MARSTTTKAKANKEEAKKPSNDPKFTVNDLVDATGMVAESVRVALRGLGVKKDHGNQYGWNSKKDFDTVVKAMKERSAKRPAPADKGASKPAAKGKAASRKSKATDS